MVLHNELAQGGFPVEKAALPLPASWKRTIFRSAQLLVPPLKVGFRSFTKKPKCSFSLNSGNARLVRPNVKALVPTGHSMLGRLITKYPQARTLKEDWWAWPRCQEAYTPASEPIDNRGMVLFISFKIFGFFKSTREVGERKGMTNTQGRKVSNEFHASCLWIPHFLLGLRWVAKKFHFARQHVNLRNPQYGKFNITLDRILIKCLL